MTTIHETRAAAARHLRSIGRAEIIAARWLNIFHAETLHALTTATVAATIGDKDDVREHAVIIAAAVYRGTPGEGAARTLHAAARARKIARRTVALADAWRAETLAGVTDGILEYADGDLTRTSLSMGGAPAVDGIARTSAADVVDAAAASVGGQAGAWLTDRVAEYRTHAHGCPTCDVAHVGRRVTFVGMAAHVAGHVDTDSAYHRLTRLTRGAVRMVDADAVLSSMGGAPLPGGERRGTPSHTPTGGSTPDRVTVRTPDGVTVTRRLTDGERALTAAPRTLSDVERERIGESVDALPALDGEAGSTARMTDTRRDAGMIRPRPRKGAGAGQTGPTVPVRLTR